MLPMTFATSCIRQAIVKDSFVSAVCGQHLLHIQSLAEVAPRNPSWPMLRAPPVAHLKIQRAQVLCVQIAEELARPKAFLANFKTWCVGSPGAAAD